MSKIRLDQSLVRRGLTATRSQAESYIKLGYVKVAGKINNMPEFLVGDDAEVQLTIKEQYVSRAALKLDSAAKKLRLNFKNKVVLDVGSSTGGFTDYALRHGAQKVIAVDLGSDQMHPALRDDPRIELHERTDIRAIKELSSKADIVVVDVSFISLREILPAITKLVDKNTQIVAMAKPQFEADSDDMHKGVIKNDAMRRKILKSFEDWVKKAFKIQDKADSQVPGSKGNLERFYLLKVL